MKKFLILMSIMFIIFACTNEPAVDKQPPTEEQNSYAKTLQPGNGTFKWVDTVGGWEVTITAKDSTVTGTYTGTYNYITKKVDTVWRQLGSNPPPPPIDTTTVPPVTSLAIQGYGADAVGGGNSSTVYHVTNLNASGAGSLTSGIGSNKTIVFDVSGTIKTRLYVSNVSYLTIDAYSSKKDITIATDNGDALSIDNSHHIIIRGLRFTNIGSDGNDGLNAVGSTHDVVFDHCSSFGNYDGNIDLAAVNSTGRNFTVQWCMMYSNRGSGNMLITTQNASIHHNLFIGDGSGEGAERNPYAHSNYSPKGSQTSPNFDLRNNLITAAGRYASGNGYGAVGNYVNNYYTSSKAGLINLCADPTQCGTAYVSGNFNQAKVTGGTTVSTEYTIPAKYKITTTDAKTAAKAILQDVGPYTKSSKEIQLISSITIP